MINYHDRYAISGNNELIQFNTNIGLISLTTRPPYCVPIRKRNEKSSNQKMHIETSIRLQPMTIITNS